MSTLMIDQIAFLLVLVGLALSLVMGTWILAGFWTERRHDPAAQRIGKGRPLWPPALPVIERRRSGLAGAGVP